MTNTIVLAPRTNISRAQAGEVGTNVPLIGATPTGDQGVKSTNQLETQGTNITKTARPSFNRIMGGMDFCQFRLEFASRDCVEGVSLSRTHC